VTRSAQVVICGAGMAGVSTAYQLSKLGIKDILIVDPLPPLSLTSDRSTECYRNWWPDAAMVALMNRSIDLLEELAKQSGNMFRMNRRGYLYVAADESRLEDFTARAARIAKLGAGPLRTHSTADATYRPEPSEGADLLVDPALIHRSFPYLTDRALAALHVRRAGWLSAQQLGMYLLEQARGAGVRVESSSVESIECTGGRVSAVGLNNGERVGCGMFVNAAGPYLARLGRLLGIDIPVRTELHLKVSFSDHLQVVDRAAPLLIWDDAQTLPWEPDEAEALQSDPETGWLTQRFPAGVHVRPEGSGDSRNILMLWDYKPRWMEPTFPPPLDEFYPEIALRGLSTMLPGLKQYFGRTPRPYMDGGYYVKTQENRLLAGPLPVEGTFVLGGLSGFGIMSSCAASELLAAHMTGAALPSYAAAFSPERYDDAAYRDQLLNWGDSGEL
jgi:sarcosine oxidase, subunit beta